MNHGLEYGIAIVAVAAVLVLGIRHLWYHHITNETEQELHSES